MHIIPIVEGHGEVEAVPILIRRMFMHLGFSLPEIAKPIRVPRNLMVKDYELERALRLACHKLKQPGCILILADADDDCPKDLGPGLLKRATKLQINVPVFVAVANKEYEAWFLASVVSLRGFRGIKLDAKPPQYPESIRGAKQYLTELMVGGGRYSPRVDQPAFTDRFDISEALKHCPSLNKLKRELGKINCLN